MEKQDRTRLSFSDDEEAAYSFLHKMMGEEQDSEGPRLVQAPPPPLSVEGRAHLPTSFQSRGLLHLLAQEWGPAADYYKRRIDEEGDEAEGYLGLGVALLGTNNVKRAAAFLEQGIDLEDRFPIGTLVGEVVASRPERMLSVARVLIKRHTPPALAAARSILDRYLLFPKTTQSSYLSAHALRVQSETDLERALRQTDEKLQEANAKYAEQVMISSTRHTVLIVAALVILASFVPSATLWAKGAWLLHVGTTEYVATVRLQTSGDAAVTLDGRTLYQRYLESYASLSQAADLRPGSLDAQYTALLAGNRLLHVGEGEVPVHVQRRLELELKALEARVAELDPSGSARRGVDDRVTALLDT